MDENEYLPGTSITMGEVRDRMVFVRDNYGLTSTQSDIDLAMEITNITMSAKWHAKTYDRETFIIFRELLKEAWLVWFRAGLR